MGSGVELTESFEILDAGGESSDVGEVTLEFILRFGDVFGNHPHV